MKNKIQYLSDLLNLGGNLLLCLVKEKKNGNFLFLLHLPSKPLNCLNNLIKQVERKFFFVNDWIKNGSFSFNLLMLPKVTSFFTSFCSKKTSKIVVVVVVFFAVLQKKKTEVFFLLGASMTHRAFFGSKIKAAKILKNKNL